MKNFRFLVLAILVQISFLAQAQTETVAHKGKKLQQLYLSVGTGPTITGNNEVHTFGGNKEISVTGSFHSDYIFRLGYKNTDFANRSIIANTDLFSFLEYGYRSSFFATNEIESLQLAGGKRKAINKFIQLQALGGISFNKYLKPTDNTIFGIEQGQPLRHIHYDKAYKPGVIIQAEAMFIPTCFAGLTLGAYYHYVPEISNAGMTLSLNLGLLR